MPEASRQDLEAVTRAMRGAMRYRNKHTLQLIAMLIDGLDAATLVMESDLNTTGFMVMVDPEFEAVWRDRIHEKKIILHKLKEILALTRRGAAQAKQELTQEQRERDGQSSGH